SFKDVDINVQQPNQAPVALFGMNPSPAVAGQEVTFTSLSTDDGSITSTAWEFGDGDTGTGTPVTHVYSASGSYHLILRVTDGAGVVSQNDFFVDVVDSNQPPVASFFIDPSTPEAGQAALFTSTSTDLDGTITEYHWDFGDGETAVTTTPTVEHTYAAIGA